MVPVKRILVWTVAAALSPKLPANGLIPPGDLRKRHNVYNALTDLGGGDLIQDDSSSSLEPRTQLWLDLRGTAVHPKVAMDCLTDELQDEEFFVSTSSSSSSSSSSWIDKVFLSDVSFQGLVNRSDSFVSESEILYVPQDQENFVALSKNGLSVPFGNMAVMPWDAAVVVADPMEAMSILAAGRWIILENENQSSMEEGQEVARIQAVGNFLDIASTATSGTWGIDTVQSGLLLQQQQMNESRERDKNGGVAVVCRTKSSVVQLANVLQCSRSSRSTSTTSSGILLQGEASGPSLPTALVIPFDVALWKAALYVSGPPQL